MAKFAIKVTEKLCHTYIVEAETYNEAENIVKDARSNGEIILDSDDFDEQEIGPSDTFGASIIDENDTRLAYFTKYPET